jgi:hypothetical protein
MTELDALDFNELRDTNPEKYQKVCLAASSIREIQPGKWSVKRDGATDAHAVELVTDDALGLLFGSCTCKGFKFHDGPCSHLSAVYRARDAQLVTLPRARVTSARVELVDRQQELADSLDAPAVEYATDGGYR